MRLILSVFLIASLAACASWGALTQEELVPDDTMERVKAAKNQGAATQAQKEKFGILADFAGHMYRGVPTEASSESVADVQLWLWSEDGEHLIIKHRLEDGSYGGDTVISKDESNGQLSYVYKTNAGFNTTGKFSVSPDGTWEAIEEVTGQSDVTMVRSRGHKREDGALVSTSDYLKSGKWVPGHSFVYTEVWRDLPTLNTPIPE